MIWVWEAYCLLSDRRGVGANGPLSITLSDMLAYCTMTGRDEQKWRAQIIRFVPPLDRTYLKDFYDKQGKEMAQQRKKQEAAAKRNRR